LRTVCSADGTTSTVSLFLVMLVLLYYTGIARSENRKAGDGQPITGRKNRIH